MLVISAWRIKGYSWMLRILKYGVFLIIYTTSGISMAGLMYEYRTPKGVTIFTDVKLTPPFKLIRKMPMNPDNRRQLSSYRDYVKMKQQEYDHIIRSKAAKYSLPAELVHAIIEAESAYMPDAVSSAGAIGMMQLMPATAQRFGITDLTDASENIEGGTRYMRYLLDLHDSNLELAIASYNAGEEAVKRYNNKVPPYPETQQYVNRVMNYFERNL
jgi:soluble lytic murein transglycosylase-like protein